MVAVIGITAQVSPMEGLYTASAVPTIKPPPTHVAETHKHTKGCIRNTLMLQIDSFPIFTTLLHLEVPHQVVKYRKA